MSTLINDKGRTLQTIAVLAGEVENVGVCEAYTVQRKLMRKFGDNNSIIGVIDRLRNAEIVEHKDRLLNVETFSELVRIASMIKADRNNRKELKNFRYDDDIS